MLSIGFCFVLLCAHALMMPIQSDEAAMLLYIHEHGFWTPLLDYTHNTNTHPLLGIVMSIMLSAGVKSVFLFRLPSLLAGLTVLFAMDKLNNNESPTFSALLPLFLVSMPIFHDYLAMERGYAIGLAFLLWGILTYNRSMLLSASLFALATATIPVFALDVAVIFLALGISINWKQAIKTVSLAAALSIAFYSFMLKDVLLNMFSMQGGTNVMSVLIQYVSALSAFGWIIGIPLLCTGAFLSIRTIREKNFLDVLFLISLCTLPIGFPRTHLLTAALLILILFRHLKESHVVPLFAFSVLSLIILPWNTIASEPDVKPVTGYSIARKLVPYCLSFQSKGSFVVPHEFYHLIQKTEGPLRSDCPAALIIDDPTLEIPSSLRMFPDILDQYGVSMLKQDEVEKYLREKHNK